MHYGGLRFYAALWTLMEFYGAMVSCEAIRSLVKLYEALREALRSLMELCGVL